MTGSVKSARASRAWLTQEQRAAAVRRYEAGESTTAIARTLGCSDRTIARAVAKHSQLRSHSARGKQGVTDPKPCGTTAGYARHQRRKETACDPCKAAHAEHGRQRRAEEANGAVLVPIGAKSGAVRPAAPLVTRGEVSVLASREITWIGHALCSQVDPEAFYPEKGESPRRAKDVCAKCPVRQACLDDAIATDDVYYGIRGGLSARERRALAGPRMCVRCYAKPVENSKAHLCTSCRATEAAS